MASKERKPKAQTSRPAMTPEMRESQLVVLATDLAEQQLRDGSASAQVIGHYLKLGSSREQLEQEKLRLEHNMAEAKIEQLKSQERIETMYADALQAMSTYQGAIEEDYDL